MSSDAVGDTITSLLRTGANVDDLVEKLGSYQIYDDIKQLVEYGVDKHVLLKKIDFHGVYMVKDIVAAGIDVNELVPYLVATPHI